MTGVDCWLLVVSAGRLAWKDGLFVVGVERLAWGCGRWARGRTGVRGISDELSAMSQ